MNGGIGGTRVHGHDGRAETTRTLVQFTPSFYVSDSLSLIFHQGCISDAAIWQNLGILAAISLGAAVAGIQLFKKAGYP